MPRRAHDPDDDGPPPGSLERHMEYLYPDPNRPCICKSALVNGGRVGGINMGKQWGRVSTEPGCYHHGTEAGKFYADNLRRFKKTGDWNEFHIDRDEWEAARRDGGGAAGGAVQGGHGSLPDASGSGSPKSARADGRDDA